VKIEFLIFNPSPQALNKDIVKDAPPAVHTDGDPTLSQPACELAACELAFLIRGEDIRLAMVQSPIQCPEAEIFLEAQGNFPGKHIAGKPVHDRHQVNKASVHPDIRDVGTPDGVRAVDHTIPEQIWVDLMLL